MRLQLQEKEERLLAEIQRLEQEQTAWETQHADLRLEIVVEVCFLSCTLEGFVGTLLGFAMEKNFDKR